MFYFTPNGELEDDGYGVDTAPAYQRDARGERIELSPDIADHWTQEFIRRFQPAPVARRIGALTSESIAEIDRRFPIGDVIASLTNALGIAPCAPCKQRQEALNRFGNRVADFWR